MLCNNKNISPWHNGFESRNQEFDVAEKNFMFKVDVAQKRVYKNKLRFHKKLLCDDKK